MSDSILRILLVEDNTGDAALLELALVESHYGRFEVVHTRRLAEAIAQLASATFDAILLDLGLPDSQGLQTLERMRSKAAEVPIVVLTGLDDETLALGAMQQGAQDYLLKSEVERGLVARAVRYVIERKRSDMASKEAERRLALALDAVQMGIFDRNMQTGKVTWSEHHSRLLGLNLEQSGGTFDDFIQCVHPDDRAGIVEKIARSLAAHDQYRNEYRVVWPDGAVRWIEARGRAFYDEQGNPIRMMGTVVDITQRKAAEEAAKMRETDLAHLSRVNTMGQMASGLAHELNQPFGAILNYAGACLSQMESAGGSKQMAMTALRELMGETRRAGEIINRMREFVRKQEPHSKPVDLNQLVEQSLSMVQFELRRRQIGSAAELARGLPLVLADAVQIEQVLVNLVYNAADAMSQGSSIGGSVTIRTALDAKSSQICVTVTDTGPGISPENLKRLFEPFFTTKPKGLGMGLNICRSIIESHGGRLAAAPNPQGGMQFSFTLPIESGTTKCAKNQTI